jgi:hypothetical protein
MSSSPDGVNPENYNMNLDRDLLGYENLSALHAGRPLPPGFFFLFFLIPGTHLC